MIPSLEVEHQSFGRACRATLRVSSIKEVRTKRMGLEPYWLPIYQSGLRDFAPEFQTHGRLSASIPSLDSRMWLDCRGVLPEKPQAWGLLGTGGLSIPHPAIVYADWACRCVFPHLSSNESQWPEEEHDLAQYYRQSPRYSVFLFRKQINGKSPSPRIRRRSKHTCHNTYKSCQTRNET
jgi:hypothetical protein